MIGSIVSIWRYPVKSMQGEELNAAAMTDRGLLGDRAFALVDAADGKVASAKNPRKWPNLFEFRARYRDLPHAGKPLPAVRFTLPDGVEVDSDAPDINQILSRTVGRPATLESRPPPAPALEEYWPDLDGLPHRDAVTDEKMPGGAFFDLAAVHVLTTATLERLRELEPAARFEVRRFRPNIVIAPATGGCDFLENAWLGRTIGLGKAARLEITGACPRCVMTTLAQYDLPRDPAVLRSAVQHNQGNVGIYARVTASGIIRRGDPVRLE